MAVPAGKIAALLCGQAVAAVFRQKARSTLTALGIAIGIAAVVWVVAIGTAASQRVENQLQDLGTNLVWVEAGSRNVAGVRTGTHGATTLTLGDGDAILQEVRAIKSVSPQVDGSVPIADAERNWTTRYRGVSPEYLEIKKFRVAHGAAFTGEDVAAANSVCLIGKTVREQLFGGEDPVGQNVRLAGQPFVVLGLLEPKGQSADGRDQDDIVLLPYTTAQKRIRGGGQTWLDDILCSAVSAEAVAKAASQISDLMRQRHHIRGDAEPDFNIRHPEDAIKAQLDASNTFAMLLVSVACVALLVGGIGVMNVMLASVVERTNEIGVRLAVGAKEWAVQLQFLMEAVVLSLIGGLCGVAVSELGSALVGDVLGWPVAISVHALLVAAAFSMAVGVFFGWYPAWKASRLDPIQALRRE